MLAILRSNFLFKVFFLQGVPEQKLRSHLGSLGVTGNLALQPMYTLSGIFSFSIFVFKIDAIVVMGLDLLDLRFDFELK